MSQDGINTAKHPGRGAFVLFEGVDRCGKTTQSQRLVQHLKSKGVSSCATMKLTCVAVTEIRFNYGCHSPACFIFLNLLVSCA